MYKIFFVLYALVAVVSCGGDPADTEATLYKYTNEVHPDGSYNYEYASSNGLDVSETGVGSSYASGSYAYTSPEGQPIQLSYTADENGYQPRGDHLPTPPPIPDYILKGLAYIESHPFEKISLAKK
ncbi:Pupal cuticle protein Edg-78E [Lucilia cuprina]|nr:Pupal cuticle protein Edg-78E [Lucilia cuprina]